MINHYTSCDCHSPEHIVRFSTDGEEMWVEVQLHQYGGFFRRLKIAIKYLLGYQCKYGHWDCANITKKEANKLYHFIKQYKDKLL